MKEEYKSKNKVTTQGYFLKRLRDSGYYATRMYSRYHSDDIRKWTILIAPNHDSLFITCCDKGEWPWRGLFEFSDYGRKVPKGFHINTDSMEVILFYLNEFKIIDQTESININTHGRKTKEEKDTT